MKIYDFLKDIISEYTYKHHVRKELSTIIDGYINQRLFNLGIIYKNEEEQNKYRIARNQDIPNLIFLATCIYFRDKYFSGATALEINEICYGENSPGKIFFLDEYIVRNKLEELKMYKLIDIESRGDLDQIRINTDVNFEYILTKYYKGGI